MSELTLTAGCWDEDREAARALFSAVYGAPANSFIAQYERPGDPRPRWWLSMPISAAAAELLHGAVAGTPDPAICAVAGVPPEFVVALVGRMDIAPFDHTAPAAYIVEVGDRPPGEPET